MTHDLRDLISELNAYFQDGQGQLFTLHCDPFKLDAGGVEAVVKRKLEESSQKSVPALILFPIQNGLCATLQKGTTLFQIGLDPENAHQLLSQLPKWFSSLEVHHFLNWNHGLLTELLLLPWKKKIFFTHDFYSLCPSINLVHGLKKRFCGLNESQASCSACYQAFYKMHFENLKDYRQQMEILLKSFDEIRFPSEFTRKLFERVFPLRQMKTVVEPINLKYIQPRMAAAPDSHNKKIIFMGAFSNLKGAKVFREAVPQLQSLGYQPEIWGNMVPGQGPMQIPLRPYSSIEELEIRFKTENPAFAIFPAITGETFSLTFHETILLSQSLPLVSPYGNPANLVKDSGYGVAIETLDTHGIVQAVQTASEKRSELLKNRSKALDLIASAKVLEIPPTAKPEKAAMAQTTPPVTWAPPQFSHRLKRHLNYAFLFPLKLLTPSAGEKSNAAQ